MSKGWHLKCPQCKTNLPSLVAVSFQFDRHGTLSFTGACRFCLNGFSVEHNVDEISADIREAHNTWAEGHGQEQIDLHLWEQEITEGDDDG